MKEQEIRECINNDNVYKQILKNIKQQVYKGIFKKLFVSSIKEEDASKLEAITIEKVDRINLEFLKYFPNVSNIFLSEITEPINIMPFMYISGKLKEVGVYNSVIMDLNPLCDCTNIEYIDYQGDNNVSQDNNNFNFLSFLPKLYQADFTYRGLEDLSVFKNNKNLEEICVSGNKIKNLSALKGLEKLDYFEAENCNLTSLDGLLEMKNLKSLYVSGNDFTEEQKNEYRSKFSFVEKFDI